jgi:dynein heavy chain
MTEGKDALFVDFLNDLGEEIYQEVSDFPKLRARLNEALQEYNSKPKLIKMDLVLFVDAIIHVCKIYRILNLPRGHALLIGVGGSGRHSLTRLASFLQKMNVFQLEVTKGFKLKNFREFLKEMYNVAGAGMDVMKTTFIFSDNDVIMESFLEDIQNMLNLGVVPNLYTNEEMNKLRDEFRRKYRMANKGAPETPEAMDGWFFGNVADNLHLSICFSPLHKSFKDFCRSYPALINNTTIDWFMRWPDDALHEVAVKFIGEMDIDEQYVEGIASMCAYSHSTAVDSSLKM